MKRRYDAHNLKLLTIRKTFWEWRYYLKNSCLSVHIQTDYNNLHYFFKTKSLNMWQAQWAEELTMFNFIIEYKLDWQNSANVLFKRKDYKLLNNKKTLIKLLSFLQWKLSKSLWKIDLHESINILYKKQTDETEKLKYLISRLLIIKTVSKKTTCWTSTVSKLCEIIEKL